jgi:hypothetical protein
MWIIAIVAEAKAAGFRILRKIALYQRYIGCQNSKRRAEIRAKALGRAGPSHK